MYHGPRSRRTAAVLVALAMAVAACSGDGDDAVSTTTGVPATVVTTTIVTPTTSDAPVGTALPTTSTTAAAATTTTTPPTQVDPPSPVAMRPAEPFADYRWVPALGDDRVYAGPATPTSFDDVLLVPMQEWRWDNDDWSELSAAKGTLEQNGFAVIESGFRFFHDGYKSSSYEYEPLFITTDALYHSWHLVFDKVLRDTEQQVLLPALEDMLVKAVAAARVQEQTLAGTDLADAAHRVTAYYEAAASMLALDIGQVNELATEEIAMIEAGAGMQTSPITGLIECQAPNAFVGCVDFSLFLPRGHYNRTPELQRYFRAMSVLGQEGFALDKGIGVVPGLLMSRIIVDDPSLLEGWTAIYEPTSFLVGLADDVSPLEIVAAADSAMPGWSDDPSLLLDADVVQIATAVLEGHPVAIDPERASVRSMGARFTLDSFILDQLAWPNVGREPPEERRVLVSALDVAAAFGSQLARDLQMETESVFYRYEDQLDAMIEFVASRPPDDWAGTVYDAWLIAIEPQFQQRGAAYPDFMQNEAWTAKAIQTGLASYTELKHDTVLYTKQGSAGEGEGPEPPTFDPRNWVEPDPVAFGRIAAAAELLRTGFADRRLLTPETEDLLATLIELSDWLAGIAVRELDGTLANDTENARLDRIGSELEYLWFATSDIDLDASGQPIPDWNERAGLVTDIFTTSFEYLQLGTGAIDTIHVVVPIADGRFELATGYVPSYYEFWRSSGKARLTDEEWRMIVSEQETPLRPRWTSPFLISGQISEEAIVRM